MNNTGSLLQYAVLLALGTGLLLNCATPDEDTTASEQENQAEEQAPAADRDQSMANEDQDSSEASEAQEPSGQQQNQADQGDGNEEEMAQSSEEGTEGEDGTSQEERMEQAARAQQERQKANNQQAQALLESARMKYEKGNLEEALSDVEKALELNPRLTSARQLQETLLSQLGRLDQSREGEGRLDQFEALEEQHLMRVRRSLQQGQKAYNNENYETAIEQFQLTLDQIKFAPFEGPDLEDIQNQAEEYLSQAEKLYEEQQRQQARKRRRAIEQEAEQQEAERRQERGERIRAHLERARNLFENQQYEQAHEALSEAQRLDPSIQEIKEMKQVAWRMSHQQRSEEIRNELKTEWRRWQRNLQDKTIAQSEVFDFPSNEEWERISSRTPPGITEREEELSDREQQILNTLRATEFTVSFNNDDIDFIRRTIQQQTGVDIQLDRATIEEDIGPIEDITATISFEVPQDALTILETILDWNDLSWTFEHGIFTITTQQVTEEVEFQIYDIRDLDLRLQNFPAPEPGVVTGSEDGEGGGGGGFGQQQEDEEVGFAGEDIESLIRDVISPQTWNDTQLNATLNFDDGFLIVRNRPDVHEEIEALLQNIRQATGVMVHIEARFVEAQTSYWERLKTELRGLDPTMDEFSTGTDRGDDFADLSAGFQHSRSGSQDVTTLARTEHNFDAIAQRAFATVDESFYQGFDGAAMQVSVLSDFSANLILDSVQKDGRATEAVATQLTLFNQQRGNFYWARQRAYVRDVEPQVAVGSVVVEPIPGVTQDQAYSLDVRPTVSHDRRYIMMELRPTVAQLVELDELETIIGGSVFGGPEVAVIQRPIVDVEKVRTTVAVPDGGSLVLGGLASTVQDRGSSGVPVLEDIPVLGLLTQDQTELEDLYELIIFVSGRIILLEEEERHEYPEHIREG